MVAFNTYFLLALFRVGGGGGKVRLANSGNFFDKVFIASFFSLLLFSMAFILAVS